MKVRIESASPSTSGRLPGAYPFSHLEQKPSTFPTRVTGREKEEGNKDRKKILAVQGWGARFLGSLSWESKGTVLGPPQERGDSSQESVGHREGTLGFMLRPAATNKKLEPWKLPCTHVNVGKP